MRFIYLYDVEQFGQKCNIVYYNNATTGEFMISESSHGDNLMHFKKKNKNCFRKVRE